MGSVSAGGFGALLADKSFSETDAEHDFRWLACDGGSGEVVAHLDRFDPPSGRCVRAGDAGKQSEGWQMIKLKTGLSFLALIGMVAQGRAAELCDMGSASALKTAAVQQETDGGGADLQCRRAI